MIPQNKESQKHYINLKNQFYLMESQLKMISIAGKQHDRLKKIRPLNTPDRLRMYHSIHVSASFSPKAERNTMDTIGRDKQDSYFLRNNKQMVLNTDYRINQSLTFPTSPRNGFSKGQFTRIIGDVRDEDYSVPLPDNCNDKCRRAVLQNLPHQQKIVTTRDTHKYRKQHHNMDFQKQIKLQSIDIEKLPSYLKRQKSIVSTLDSQQVDQSLNSLLKSRRKKNDLNESFETHQALKKIRKFQNSIGHKYGQLLYKPKKIPEFYDIQKSNESLTKKSMSSPRGHIKFDRYRKQIKTRIDRSDPHWGMTINYEDTHNNPQWEDSSSYQTVSFEKMASRKPNQVFSKYPIRQSMQLAPQKQKYTRL